MENFCLYCGKSVKNLSGLSRHLNTCRGVRNHQRRYTDRRHRHLSTGQLTTPVYNESIPDPLETDNSKLGNDDSLDSQLNSSQEEAEDTQQEGSHLREDRVSSHRSSVSSIRTETFEKTTGRSAGKPIGGKPFPSRGATHDLNATNKKYSPFSGATEYALVHWLLQAKCSKGDIDRLLSDPDLTAIHNLVSFKTYEEMVELVHQIPHGIQDDQWTTSEFTVQSMVAGIESQAYQMRHRDVLRSIEFLLGHRPFVDHLSYAPVRHFNGEDGQRIYNELHTADWWWETQLKLPSGATIVPLLLSTDKTVMTQHHGDETCWPLYISIGNIDGATRRKQTVPSSVMLGQLPITKELDNKDDVKSHVYHLAMERILARGYTPLLRKIDVNTIHLAIEKLGKEGFNVTCADGYVRLCYPIIAGMTVDYEEQALITGVKSGRHCSICTVPSDERENLTKVWPARTHRSTQQQIARQRLGKISKTHEDWVHDVTSFAWKQPYLNIHDAMMVDILHQLLKGIVMHLLTWIKSLLGSVAPTGKRKRGSLTLQDSSGEAQLDDRFSKVPYFPGLKRFRNFSHIKQWTGDEQKAIVRQLIPVIAPLLVKRFPEAMHCTRAVIDFIMIASYKTHSESTLQYLEHALYRIDKTKEAFRAVRRGEGEDEGHFNFPKFHMMSHYANFIRRFGSADGVDTSHSEAGHKYHLKAFYSRTNKGETYLDQIFAHNIRRQNELAMSSLLLYESTAAASQGKGSIQVYGTRTSREVDLTAYGSHVTYEESTLLQEQGLNHYCWRTAESLDQWAQVEGFIDALAVFVRENRNMLAGVRLTDAMLDRREVDPTWVNEFPVALHPSLHCWRPEGKNSSEIDALSKEIVRCSPRWRGGTKWRRDFVWVQEYNLPDSGGEGSMARPLHGRLVGQLQLIISVDDPQNMDTEGRFARYTGALVKLLRFRNNGRPHPIHGMVEVEDWHLSQAMNARNLGPCRFYDMSTILRSAHIVPGTPGTYYINNYVDWDQYNTLYDPDFITLGIRDADAVYKKYTSIQRQSK